MFINVEETPNPDTLKFIPENEIKVDKSFMFNKDDYDSNNSFLKTIFEVDGVVDILIDKEFISITKSKTASWDFIRTIATSKIGAYLEENNYILNFENGIEKRDEKKKKLTDLEKEICLLLDTRVKPVVAGHGGEISFHSFKNGTVFLELKGSCSGCPSSTATLKMGIENMLKHYHPEIKEVEEVLV